jgi:hypothetical protein
MTVNGCVEWQCQLVSPMARFCALGGQGPCLFAHPSSGLLHFSRTAFNGTDIIALGRPTCNATTGQERRHLLFSTQCSAE